MCIYSIYSIYNIYICIYKFKGFICCIYFSVKLFNNIVFSYSLLVMTMIGVTILLFKAKPGLFTVCTQFPVTITQIHNLKQKFLFSQFSRGKAQYNIEPKSKAYLQSHTSFEGSQRKIHSLPLPASDSFQHIPQLLDTSATKASILKSVLCLCAFSLYVISPSLSFTRTL